MKRFFLLKVVVFVVLITLGLFSNLSHAITMTRGVVVLDHYECSTYDYIVIETSRGFTTAQVYSGYSATHSGKEIYGDLHSYGFEYIYDKYGDQIGRIWIDDYMVDSSKANEWCFKE